MNKQDDNQSEQPSVDVVRSSELLSFPSWEEATAGITDSRFVGHRHQKAGEQYHVQSGARIMYDRLYMMLNKKQEG